MGSKFADKEAELRVKKLLERSGCKNIEELEDLTGISKRSLYDYAADPKRLLVTQYQRVVSLAKVCQYESAEELIRDLSTAAKQSKSASKE